MQSKLNFQCFEEYKESLREELESRNTERAQEALSLFQKIGESGSFADLVFFNYILLEMKFLD